MYLQIIDVICLQLIPINDKSLLKNPRYKLIDILIHEYSNINKSHICVQTRERASSVLTLPTIVTAFTRMEKRKKKKNESIENYCKQLTISQVSRCAKSVIHELITSQNLSTTIVTAHSSVCFFVGRNVRKRVYDGQSGIEWS